MSTKIKRVSTGYSPREFQQYIHERVKRFSVIVAHRRFGKTHLAINHILHKGLTNPLKTPQYAYIAPLFGQAKRVAWQIFKQYALNIPGAYANEAELRIDIPRPAQGDFIRILLLGADNPDNLRGIYLDGAVLDEYADMNPSVWTRVIRPTLSDRIGWAMFIGTLKGENAFYKMYLRGKADPEWFAELFPASRTNVIPKEELESARKEMTEDDYSQEYECVVASIQGAIYGKEMQAARKEGRVRRVPFQPALPVRTFWDLGINDTTAIWFMQEVHGEYHAIDYMEDSGVALPEWVKRVKNTPYSIEEHILPHDAKARSFETGKTREETFRSLGLRVRVLPKIAIEDGIHAAKMIFARVYFDEEKCERGLEALSQYQRKWDEKNMIFSSAPLHNFASNGSDAFRYFALGTREERTMGRRNLQTVAESEYNLFTG